MPKMHAYVERQQWHNLLDHLKCISLWFRCSWCLNIVPNEFILCAGNEGNDSLHRPGLWTVRDVWSAVTAWCLAELKILASSTVTISIRRYILALEAVKDALNTTMARCLAVLKTLVRAARTLSADQGLEHCLAS